ncbi:MAG: PEGA domain-containing protein [Methanoregula sp.]|nr:PEGA domain-containing protein [Methanoregula sp.]
MFPKTAIGTAIVAALLIIMPVAAINVAVYGGTAGFDPALHRDTFTVVYSLPGTSGAALDTNILRYTNTSVDVIFFDGGEPFGPTTTAQIENAVASGKILVLADTNYQNFSASLPVSTADTAPASAYITVTSPNTTFSQDIFSGLRTQYPNTTPVTSRTQFVANPDAVTLISFSNGNPALAYGKYGNGYVIVWAPSSIEPYLTSTEADRINERLITHLLALRGQAPMSPTVTTVPPTTIITTAIPTTVTTANLTLASNTTMTELPVQIFGNVSVYSSPLGAAIFIDGIYRGTTPANLSAILPGNHALKLAMGGYYDYDTTIYVMGTGTMTAFGTLPPRENGQVQPTPTVVLPVTVNATVTTAPAPLWENPSVIAAVLGIFTAIIGAAVTLFTIYHKHKNA